MKTLDGTLYRRALDCSGPQSAHTRIVPRAGGQSPLWVKNCLERNDRCWRAKRTFEEALRFCVVRRHYASLIEFREPRMQRIQGGQT